MKLFKNRESGQVLIMALILLALGSLLVIPLLRQSFTNLGYHRSIECRTLNSYSADAGIVYATAKIYTGDYIETPLDESFTINGRTVNVTARYQSGGLFSVNSTASGGGCGRTRITILIRVDHGAFAYAAAGKDLVKNEFSFIDSEPTTGEADIRSNDKITIVGPASVNGDAYHIGDLVGEEYITGTILPVTEEVVFPDPYATLYESIAKEGGTYNGNLEYDDGGTHYAGPIYVTGNFKVIDNTHVILAGPVYAAGNLEIKSGGILEGNHYLFAEGNIVIEGGGYGSDEIPVIITPDHNISVKGPVVDGVLYAPNGSVVIQDAQVYGAAAGKSVTIINSILIYAESLHGRSDLPGSELFPLIYSYE